MSALLFLDGAMGTMLQRLGLAPGDCPELANIAHPEWVAEIHRSYSACGADIVETNTFGANRIRLADYGLAERAHELSRAGVRLAREATRGMLGGSTLIAASMGPTGKLMEPYGDLGADECYDAFREQAEAFREAGADLVSIETMSSLDEAMCALAAVRDGSGLPAICHLTFERTGRTLMGVDAATAAKACQDAGAFAVGANCSIGPSEMVSVIRAMSAVARVPVSAEPNAGSPELVGGSVVYPVSPEEMAEFAEELVRAGATIVGGCCGTTPAHIAAVRRRLASVRGEAPARDVFARMSEQWRRSARHG